MTIMTERPATTWQMHPGWGIAVDLTPREVVQARQVRIHQRLIVLALVLVLTLCVGAGLLTHASTGIAQRNYDQEQATTVQLATAAEKYAPITGMQTVTTQIRADLSVVMAQDVDVVNLLAQVRTALPAGLRVTTEAVLLTPPVAPLPAAPAADGTIPAPVADALPQVIGSVNISGTGPKISDVAPFVSALNDLRGVVDVLPVSVTQSEQGMDFTISLNITDQLYTDRFSPAGAK